MVSCFYTVEISRELSGRNHSILKRLVEEMNGITVEYENGCDFVFLDVL